MSGIVFKNTTGNALKTISRNNRQIGWIRRKDGMLSIDIPGPNGKPESLSIAAVVYKGTAENIEHAMSQVVDVCHLIDAALGCKDGAELQAKMLRDSDISTSFPQSRLDLVVQLVNGMPTKPNKKEITCPECGKPAEFDAFRIDFRGNRVCPNCQYNGNTTGIDFNDDEDFCNLDWNNLFDEYVFVDDVDEEEGEDDE